MKVYFSIFSNNKYRCTECGAVSTGVVELGNGKYIKSFGLCYDCMNRLSKMLYKTLNSLGSDGKAKFDLDKTRAKQVKKKDPKYEDYLHSRSLSVEADKARVRSAAIRDEEILHGEAALKSFIESKKVSDVPCVQTVNDSLDNNVSGNLGSTE
jgi:hypothetical protein